MEEVRPYSVIVQFQGQFYEIILWLNDSEMEAWDKEVDLETIHCIADMSHQLDKLNPAASGAIKM